jgi:hypothetical protein
MTISRTCTAGERPGSARRQGILRDKLTARIACERASVRLYEALILKAQAAPATAFPKVSELRRLRDEEAEHLDIATAALQELGGDPAVLTPSACRELQAGRGILDVAGDSRTTLVGSSPRSRRPDGRKPSISIGRGPGSQWT